MDKYYAQILKYLIISILLYDLSIRLISMTPPRVEQLLA